jgi:transposase InsO family protein
MTKYHPRATTNKHIRKIIQQSSDSSHILAERFGINKKTVLKWKKRKNLEDRKHGTKTNKYILSRWEQKIIVKARKHLKLALDDLVLVVIKYIPKANRDNVYRTLKRHKLNKLPDEFSDKGKGKFGFYLPGFLHIDLAYLPILPGTHNRRYLLVAIDRVTKLVFIKIVTGKTQDNAINFLKSVVSWYPYRIHRILTDNGKEFGKRFTQACKDLGIKHKRTKVKHPWTNGQAERIIQSIKKGTVKKVFYKNHKQMKQGLIKWANDYNMKKKLKSIKLLTPYQKMVEYYKSLNEQKRKERFKKVPDSKLIIEPLHHAT